MRGYPPFHILLVLVFAGIIAWPLLHLTGKEGARMHASENHEELAAPTEAARQIAVTVRVSHPPRSLKLFAGDRDLLAGASMAAGVVSLDVEMPVTKDGLEWRLEGEWPEASPDAAVSVTVEPDGLEGLTETRWSGGALLESFLVYVWTE